jgi:hypothetical protein
MEEVIIDGKAFVPKDNSTIAKSCDGKTCVLVRSYAAGVHFGYLEKEEFTLSGKVVTLSKTRRAWSWSGAASLSQMALEGVKNPNDCKFSVELPQNEIVNVIETIPITEAAKKNLFGVPIWKS